MSAPVCRLSASIKELGVKGGHRITLTLTCRSHFASAYSMAATAPSIEVAILAPV